MKGYKVFNPDWTCKGFRYEVGKTYELEGTLKICENGFHFCEKAIGCFKYYDFSPRNKVAEVEAIGNVITEGNKSCTDKIKILKELSWEDVLKLVNVGSSNTGFGNSGSYNSGRYNSGKYNSGSYNSGDCNSGNYNSGDGNSGYRNSGHRNSGHFNSGDHNSGDHNSGIYNSGDYNSGDWNICDYSNGCFNTKEQKIYMFDKLSDWTLWDWMNSEAYDLFNRVETNEWIPFEYMSETEKKSHPDAERLNGYLCIINKFDACKKWWSELTSEEKSIIKELPNFDAKIFKQITGIDVDEDGEINEDQVPNYY